MDRKELIDRIHGLADEVGELLRRMGEEGEASYAGLHIMEAQIQLVYAVKAARDGR